MPVPRFRDCEFHSCHCLCGGLSHCEATITDGLSCTHQVRPAPLMHGSARRRSLLPRSLVCSCATRSGAAGDIHADAGVVPRVTVHHARRAVASPSVLQLADEISMCLQWRLHRRQREWAWCVNVCSGAAVNGAPRIPERTLHMHRARRAAAGGAGSW